MLVETDHTGQKVIRTAVITEAEPILVPNSRIAGQTFRPDVITIRYALTDGLWTVVGTHAAIVGGFILKKDGTDSLNRYSGPGYRAWADDRPEWILKIINSLRPVGQAFYPVAGQIEVPQ